MINENNHTEEYILQCSNLKYSRKIKKALNRYSFFGYELCIRYKPELESIEETKTKLSQQSIVNQDPKIFYQFPLIKRRRI